MGVDDASGAWVMLCESVDVKTFNVLTLLPSPCVCIFCTTPIICVTAIFCSFSIFLFRSTSAITIRITSFRSTSAIMIRLAFVPTFLNTSSPALLRYLAHLLHATHVWPENIKH